MPNYLFPASKVALGRSDSDGQCKEIGCMSKKYFHLAMAGEFALIRSRDNELRQCTYIKINANMKFGQHYQTQLVMI